MEIEVKYKKMSTVWNDDDQDQKTNELKEEEHYPMWAMKNKTETITIYHAPKMGVIEEGFLDYKSYGVLNSQKIANSVALTAKFHPSNNIAFVGGRDKNISLFAINENQKSTHRLTIALPDLPIHMGSWIQNGEEIIAVGPKSYYYSANPTTGRISRIPLIEKELAHIPIGLYTSDYGEYYAIASFSRMYYLIDTKTKHMMYRIRTEGEATSAVFTHDGMSLWTLDSNGHLIKWESRMNFRASLRLRNHHTLGGTALDISPDGKTLACGYQDGIVSLYDTHEDKVIKNYNNLTTKIRGVKFNHDGNLLAIYSRSLEDQIRFIHVPTQSVYKNIPDRASPMGHINTFDIANNSSLFLTGNEHGTVQLWELPHYSSSLHNISYSS